MRIFFICILMGFSCCFFGQGKEKRNAMVTVRGNIGIPKPISSKMYRIAFAGLYEGNLSVNLRLFGNIYAGAGYQNSHFKNNEFLKFTYFQASIPYNTRLIGHGGFVKLGTDKFFSDKGYMSYALNSGIMIARYINVNEDTTKANKPFAGKNFSCPYLQPEMSVNFIVDNSLCFSIMLSYTTLFNRFDPKAPRFNQFGQVVGSSNKYVMSWFNLGFGFTVLLNR